MTLPAPSARVRVDATRPSSCIHTMSDYTIKQEDSLPVFETSVDADLSQADEVRLYVEHALTDTLVVNDTMTVVDGPAGDVEYDFDANQTAREGYHLAEIVATYSGEERTFPPDGYYTFDFVEQLDRDGDVDPAEAALTLTLAKLILAGNIVTDDGSTIYDYSTQSIQQAALENDSLTVTAGTNLGGGGAVSLGGSVTLNLEQLTAALDAAGNDITDVDRLTAGRLEAGGALSRTGVAAGESLTVPDGYSLVVDGPYDLDGELTVDGRMRVL
jgi:hypothetical protein